MKHRSSLSIKWKIFLCFGLFTGCLILLLWLFQIVFLEDFYKWIKTSKIYSSAQLIEKNLQEDNLQELVDSIARQEGICIRVLDVQGQDVYSSDVQIDCMIHRMTSLDLAQRYLNALQNEGEYLERFVREVRNEFYFNGSGRMERMPNRTDLESIVYTKVVATPKGAQAVLLLNALISPVDATVQTLRVQLTWISVGMVLLSLGLSLLFSKHISKPIERVTAEAKNLSEGSYSINFNGRGYWEVEQLNKTLSTVAEELSRTEQLRRDLIANVSHDLRTPLTLIAGYGEMMRDLPGENTPDNVQIIIDEAQRLTSLVNDLLDLSKLQAGTQKLTLADLSITEVVRSTLGRYQKLVEQDGYTVRFEYQEEIRVLADQVKISQVIYNLINNAVNYTGTDKLVIVRQRTQGEEVIVEVQDTGEGIPPEHLRAVWDRYYKLDKTHKRAAIGTGLGLSIVKSVMDLHGGRYGVQSTPGVGSTFWFSLRMQTQQAQEL